MLPVIGSLMRFLQIKTIFCSRCLELHSEHGKLYLHWHKTFSLPTWIQRDPSCVTKCETAYCHLKVHQWTSSTLCCSANRSTEGSRSEIDYRSALRLTFLCISYSHLEKHTFLKFALQCCSGLAFLCSSRPRWVWTFLENHSDTPAVGPVLVNSCQARFILLQSEHSVLKQKCVGCTVAWKTICQEIKKIKKWLKSTILF